MIEKFVDIPGYEGRYKISNFGSIYSLISEKPLQQSLDSYGYRLVTIYAGNSHKGKTWKVHQLVLLSFVGPPPGKLGVRVGEYNVNHIDGSRINNRLDNLEYLLSEVHSKLNSHKFKGEDNGNSKLNERMVKQLRHLYATGDFSFTDLARIYNLNISTISRAISGKRWTITSKDVQSQVISKANSSSYRRQD